MANLRDKSKKLVGFYASPEEKKALEKLAKQRGISVSELLRQLAAGTIKIGLFMFLAFHLTRTPKAWNAAALKATAHAGWVKLQQVAR